MNPDFVSDIKPTGEPSVVGVAVCAGTDLDGHPITVVDRVCLNKESANIWVGQVDGLEQSLHVCEMRDEENIKKIQEMQSEVGAYLIGSIVFFFIVVFFLGRTPK